MFGPGTFINTAVNQITDELARRSGKAEADAKKAADAARKLSAKRGDPKARQSRLAARARQLVQGQFSQASSSWRCATGSRACRPSTTPTSSPRWCSISEARRSAEPKSRFAYLFPSPDAALIQVRLRPASTTPSAAARST